MRTISKRTQYGLKAVLNLARRYGEGPVLIATVSQEESIPIKFLELILLNLKSQGRRLRAEPCAGDDYGGVTDPHDGRTAGASALRE